VTITGVPILVLCTQVHRENQTKIHDFLHNNDWSLVLMIALKSEQPKIDKLIFFSFKSKSDLWVFQGTEDFLKKKSTKK